MRFSDGDHGVGTILRKGRKSTIRAQVCGSRDSADCNLYHVHQLHHGIILSPLRDRGGAYAQGGKVAVKREHV